MAWAWVHENFAAAFVAELAAAFVDLGPLATEISRQQGETVAALARSRLTDPASCIQRCHLFPFGSLVATEARAAALAAGAFKLRHDDTELLV